VALFALLGLWCTRRLPGRAAREAAPESRPAVLAG